MESGQKIEAGESKTHPISSTGEVGLPISSKKLVSSLSSASDSSSDSSFELILNDSSEFPGGTSDPLKTKELNVAGHSESEFEFISSDDIETRSAANLPSAAKTSSRSLSRSSSSSSASESSLCDHVIELPKPEKNKDSKGGVSNNPSSPSMDKDNRLVEDFSDDDVPISSMASNGQSPAAPTNRIDLSAGSEAATQYPQTQLMERVDDPNSPSYRIPSHVFSRTKSKSAMEWSVASNESLFSIHMGNMSFTREQLCWLGKSGELYRPGETAMSPLIDLPSHDQPLTIKPSDGGLKGTHPNGDLAANEAQAAETMREVIRENSENHRKESATLTESSSQSASLSHQSEGSTKSFQFPILTGDGGKSISFKGGDPEKAKQETKLESPQPAASSSETPKESSTSESPKAAANAPKRWFSCFSCCPFCS
ncbi:uncharacterized protein LOC111007326 isoform X2 [Momordica charantia]|uniref:Uncharacterized protein LOC111007326 isoform X2 n=1 Tax=Momordica charantia TaxID=3673 RepID=A0A6J1C0F1_MOMCH|nr:uncharacterized protein LOC111007326 isoform X2 [Momordica charantia]